MSATIHSINLIATDPQVRSGRPYIIGSTLTVADIAIVKIFHQQDADGIATWFGITLLQVYAALTYYYDHQAEMDEQIHAQTRYGEELKDKRVGSKDSLLPRWGHFER